MNRVLFSSQSDEWATPDDLYKALDKEFNFTLDAAASEQNHKSNKYYTKDCDGLSKSWGGRRCFVTRHIAILKDGLLSVTKSH